MSNEEQENIKVNAPETIVAPQVCSLCNIPEQEVLVEYQRWRLVRTKTMKGHKERLMLLHKKHVRTLDEGSIGEAYLLMMKAGSKRVTTWDALCHTTFGNMPKQRSRPDRAIGAIRNARRQGKYGAEK